MTTRSSVHELGFVGIRFTLVYPGARRPFYSFKLAMPTVTLRKDPRIPGPCLPGTSTPGEPLPLVFTYEEVRNQGGAGITLRHSARLISGRDCRRYGRPTTPPKYATSLPSGGLRSRSFDPLPSFT